MSQKTRTIDSGVQQFTHIYRMIRVRTHVVKAWMLLLRLASLLVIRAMGLVIECTSLNAVEAKGVCLFGET